MCTNFGTFVQSVTIIPLSDQTIKRDGVIAKRSRVKENDSNDSDFPLKLMEKTTNSMDIG